LPKLPFYHATIVITDDSGHVTNYIESGPRGGKNSKIIDGTYSNDRFRQKGLLPSNDNGKWQEQFDGPIEKISPSGLDTKELESKLRDAANRYDNNSNYAALPDNRKGTTNSNSFAFSVLREGLFGGNDALNEKILSTPEYIENRNKNRAEAHPDVSEWRVPGWDLDVSLD
jgi:hypothetical protein